MIRTEEMFQTKDKLDARITELSDYRYRDQISIPSFQFMIDEEGKVGTHPPVDGEWETIQVGDRWEGKDLYAWLTCDVQIPETWHDRQIIGLFDLGDDMHEALLFLGDSPYQGIDENHQEVFFSSDLAGKTVPLRFRLWSGFEGGIKEHKIKQAEVAWLDEETDDLYFTGKAILETVNVLNKDSPEHHELLNMLDRSFHQIDWSYPGSETFYQSVKQAQTMIKHELEYMEKHHPATIHCIGHSHIDAAWKWRLNHTREKIARTFSTVLRLMERYPEYTYTQSSPQFYDYLKHDYPEIFEQIKDRVNEGRWEAEGSMWLEADNNLPSGESLVRQILVGTRFFQDEFGIDCKILWLPDTFGYSWALPQILKKSGIDYFMTIKISWGEYDRMPHDTFFWKGVDGSEVLTHFSTTPASREAHPDDWQYIYNSDITPPTVVGTWNNYQDKQFNNDLSLLFGHGDGGGGPTREMLEYRRRLDDLKGIPHVKTNRADQFFETLQQNVEDTDQYIHTWDGELYLEYHRGTYTSQAYNKLMNRRMELLYRETEWLNVLSGILHTNLSDYPHEELLDGWKIILRNQFHDILPGTALHEVYEDSKAEYEQANAIGVHSWNKAAQAMLTQEPDQTQKSYTIFNSAPWKRTDVLEMPIDSTIDDDNGIWLNEQGDSLTAQKLDNKWLIQADSLPSMGYTSIYYQPNKNAKNANASASFYTEGSGIVTPYYRMTWNQAGQLTEIYDRQSQRQILAEDEKGNVLQVFEDKPIDFDAWNIDISYQEKMREVSDLNSISVMETNAIRSVVRFKWNYMNSTIHQDMILYADNPRIDFKTEVNWHEQDQLLKVAFPVNIRASEATYDIQYGNAKRPTNWNMSWNYARYESVGHQWADLSEGNYGVSLLNDCKYGYDIKGNLMRLSLIKSATYPDEEQDQGEHIFTYAILPHKGDWYSGHTVQEAWELNNPLTFAQGKSQISELSVLYHDADHIMVDAVKKAEDENKIVIRVHEFAGSRGTIHMQSDFTIQSWQETNLMEQEKGALVYQEPLTFYIKPYEIKTFLVDMIED